MYIVPKVFHSYNEIHSFSQFNKAFFHAGVTFSDFILWKVVLISPHSSSIHQYPFFSQYNVLLCCRTAFGLLGRIPVVISGLCVLGSTSFPGQF